MSLDALLIVGSQDRKLQCFLSKLGYDLIDAGDGNQLNRLISNTVVDLILIDSRMELDGLSLCDYLRNNDLTKQIPIVFLAADYDQKRELESRKYERVECLEIPYSVGTVTSRIATQLRLRKLAGAENPHASLLEMNAALRDLNQRLKAELEQARAIQLGLLPKSLPVDPRFELAALYQPLEEVGGDWYYARLTEGGKLSIQIADVSGHGLSAALVGSMAKLAISAAREDDPVGLLRAVNRLMTPQLPEGRFVTMASCLFDPRSGLIHFANAGHPPALLIRRESGVVEELKGQGFAIGFFEDGDYEPVEREMSINDILVLMTDGITEIRNRGNEVYGSQRLSKVVADSRTGISAAQLTNQILSSVDEFRDGRMLKDDVTLLILKRTG